MSRIRTLQLLRVCLMALTAGACADSPNAPGETEPRVTHSVTVVAPSTAIATGDTLALSARALDAAGKPIPGRTVAWSTSDPLVASVSAVGVVVAHLPGTVTISATVDGTTGSAALTVGEPPVASIGVGPTAFVLEVGMVRQLAATLHDKRGNVLTGRMVQWTTDAAAASISSTGLVTALAPGYVTFHATSEGQRGTATGTVVEVAGLDYDLLYTRESGTNTNELYLLDLRGAPVPVRLNAGTTSRQPTASPDGRRIAFAVSQFIAGTNEEIHDIFAVDRNGLNVKRLTASAAFEDSPAWSPDGRRIVYRSITVDASLRQDLYVMNADGSEPTRLTGDLPVLGILSAPRWSPDGTRIAYATSEPGVGGTRSGIWTMNADGSDKRQITSTLTGFDGMPSWSPDGRRIVFTRYFGEETDLAIVTLATGQITRVPLPGSENAPAWSPDGTVIAFTAQRGPQSVIYTVRPSGADLHLRTINPAWGDAWFPSWTVRP